MKASSVKVLIVAVVLAMGVGACGAPAVDAPTAVPPSATAAVPQPTVAPLAPANQLEAQIEAVYAGAEPSVVQITSDIIGYNAFMQPVPEQGTGSGFVYDTDGHIVTNYHVVENAQSVSVTLSTGETYAATVIGGDPSNDLAVLTTEATSLPAPIALADSSQLKVGQIVAALGNPFGLNGTLTVGVVSALGRIIQSPDGRFIGEAIQTDAAINPGNSGGPLLDLEGRVVGIDSQIISPSDASAGIGFAVPSSAVKRVVPQLIANGKYAHPWLGVQLIDITPDRAAALQQAGMKVPVQQGVLVVDVVAGSPADKAGIRAGTTMATIGNTSIPIGGDIITAINGQSITGVQQLTVYLEDNTQVGDTIDVTLIRDGQEMTVKVTLAERPANG
jgi:S1-C subfamily serine protease